MAVNETPLPSFVKEGAQQLDKEILASMVNYRVVGGTVVSGQTLAAGTLLGRVTASGKYAAYNDALATGVEVCKGILLKAVAAVGGDVLCDILVSGTVKYDQLVGYDAAALVDLKGTVDTVRNELKF